MYASDVRHSSKSLGDKLAHIYTLGKKVISQDFRPEYRALLEAFGNPHKKLPPVIHVAGTNGKGSVVATLRAILEEQGYKVHAYTSPHLIEFNERIVLAGKTIDNDFLESLIDEALELNGNNDITFFELTTALAFAAFSRVPADVLLLEVGLGGRMDCTNIIEKPLATIISAIGMDHMEFLGDTVEKIAAEKGGIIKPGRPCVISVQTADSVNKMLENIAAKKGSPLSRAGSEWFTQDNGDMFKFVHDSVEMTLPRPNLQGTHQIANAGAALAALRLIKDQLPVSDAAIKSGLRKIKWPARLQNLTKDFSLPNGWELWLDGGHNENAAQVLAEQARRWNTQDSKNLHLILGMMNRKDPVAFVKILQNHVASITFVGIPDEPQMMKSKAGASLLHSNFPNLKIGTAPGFEAAIRSVTSEKQGRILIAGSLYLAGHVLSRCGNRA
jgi:dihydrofolate synthase/folylpolyglutamate synthase